MKNQLKPVKWEKVYIFISSTFNDMHAERDYLVKQVFPKLGEWCERRKLHMVDIDLRWGVTEADATQNRNVVNVCLNRIDACRPFFVCFLGQRYGWIPQRQDISEETIINYPGLEDAINKGASVTELEILHSIMSPFHSKETIEEKDYYRSEYAYFYLRDDSYLQYLPDEPSYLRRIYSDAEETNEQERKKLQAKRDELVQKIRGEKRPLHIYQARWSEAKTTPELALPLQCPATLEKNQERWRNSWRNYAGVHVAGLDVAENPSEAEKAREFNQKLTEGRPVDFSCDGEDLGSVVLRDLVQAIEQRFPAHKEVDDRDELQKEMDQQEQFVFINSEGFIRRTDDFDELDEYVEGDSNKLFVLTAEAGVGKSTLLANWVDNYRTSVRTKSNHFINFRFIGASDGSTTVYSLLRLLLREIKEVGSQFDDDIPDDPTELRNMLPELLQRTGQKGKTVIVIDALNQLETGVSDLTWLPRQLPQGIKLIVSFKRGEKAAEALYTNFSNDKRVQMTEVKPFKDKEDRRKLVQAYLSQYLKELEERYIEVLIDSPAAYNPLYLKVVLSELRVFGAFASLGEKIRSDFGDTPESAFEGVLHRLERDPAYSPIEPKQAVPLIFGLLAHARQGLSANELTSLLIQALGMENTDENQECASDTVYLFLRQVQPFLARRGGRYDFYYESFKSAALKVYASEEEKPCRHTTQGWHRLLASYFYGLPLWRKIEPKEAVRPQYPGLPNHRKVAELPYHQAHAELWDELQNTLTDFNFLEAKVWAFGPQLLIEDYKEGFKTGYKGESLAIVQDALQLSAHVLIEDPTQLAGQLLGRLMTRETLGLQKLLQEARQWNATPWLCPKTPSLSPPGGPLQLTLAGHTREVLAVAMTTNERYVISASADGTLIVWDLQRGMKVHTLTGHTDGVTAVAVTLDSRNAISASVDGTLKVWDLQRGQEVRTIETIIDAEESFAQVFDKTVFAVALSPSGRFALSGSVDGVLKVWDWDQESVKMGILKGHTSCIRAVAVTPDGRYAISGSDDCTLKVWNLEQGKEVRTLTGHIGSVLAVAVTRDGRYAVSGAGDQTIKMWDLECGEEVQTLTGLTGGVFAVAVTRDGRYVVSGSGGRVVQLWDLQRGKEMRHLPGHTTSVRAMAVTPDGQYAISGSRDYTLKVWDVKRGEVLYTLTGHTSCIRAVAVTLDGQYAISGSDDCMIKVWSLEVGKEVRRVLEALKHEEPSVREQAIRRLGEMGQLDGLKPVTLALQDEDPLVRAAAAEALGKILGAPESETEALKEKLKDHPLPFAEGSSPAILAALVGISKTGLWLRTEVLTLTGHTTSVRAVAVTPDGRYAISGSDDCTLKVWNLERGKEVRTLTGHKGSVLTIAVTPDGKYAISGSRDGTLKVWSLERGKEVRTLLWGLGAVLAVAVTPDGKWAISGHENWNLKVWDLERWEKVRTLTGHKGSVLAVAVSPDGKYAISGSDDRTLKVWDLERSRVAATFVGDSEILACAPTLDGMTIVAGENLGWVHFLQLMAPLDVPRISGEPITGEVTPVKKEPRLAARTMKMRERFTEEEWRMLKELPHDVFTFVAGADVRVDKEEMAEFNDYFANTSVLEDPLYTELLHDMVSDTEHELAGSWMQLDEPGVTPEAGPDQDQRLLKRSQRIRAFLRGKLTDDEYRAFMVSLLAWADAVARATGGQHWNFADMSKQERAARDLRAAFPVDTDLGITAEYLAELAEVPDEKLVEFLMKRMERST